MVDGNFHLLFGMLRRGTGQISRGTEALPPLRTVVFRTLGLSSYHPFVRRRLADTVITMSSSPIVPTKRIVSRAHLQAFLDSQTHADVLEYITELNESVVGTKLTDEVPQSEVRNTRIP